MIALFCLFLTLFASPFKSKSRLEAENAALRHQLIVLQRRVRGRIQLTNGDRLFLVQLYRWFPSVLKVITIIRPESPRALASGGFRQYWRWNRPVTNHNHCRLTPISGPKSIFSPERFDDRPPQGNIGCERLLKYLWI